MRFMLEIYGLIEPIKRGLNSLVSFGWTETAEPGVRLWLGPILFEDRFCGVSLDFSDCFRVLYNGGGLELVEFSWAAELIVVF
jgi:hypothetical protein